jgi:adenine-specific DNA-methyltransferase
MNQKNAEVQIKPAKGRPMLTWVGKRALRNVTAYPAQLVETFAVKEESKLCNPEVDWSDWSQDFPHSGLLFHGDNKDVLAYLLANGFRGKVKLIYIDPPFDSGADYIRSVNLRGKSTSAKVNGEPYTIGEQVQYSDIWENDSYLQFMFERLLILKELLSEDGSFYLHCDWHRIHLLRCLLDEVFGTNNFRNEIIRVKCNPKNFEREAFGNIHDTILFYSKTDKVVWNSLFEGLDSDDLDRLFGKTDSIGRKYTTVALHASGERKGPTGQAWRGILPPPGRHWAYIPDELENFDAQKRIEWSSTGNPRLIIYADYNLGRRVQDIWTMKDPIYSEYPTEKTEKVIERIINTSSMPGDVILDCFIGSGTTAAVAQKLGRRWIGADINKGAVQTTSKRLQGIMQEQQAELTKPAQQLPGLEAEKPVLPCQLSFSVYRVNDYDLQIQHNEAFNLAVEHLGMTRAKTDSFFDGTLGKKLVKIIPFNHPLTPLDLEEIKNELSSRPEESRDIAVVCLGKELAVDGWLEDWNRLRKQGDFPNKVEVIELRSDPKYGGFFIHEPDQAVVKFERSEGGVKINIEEFLSPTIIERLEQQAAGPLLKPQITDWRAMVDSIMIDANYDGQVFNITLADVPEKKSDLVKGSYLVETPAGGSVAVKITDMLGEEVLVVGNVG